MNPPEHQTILDALQGMSDQSAAIPPTQILAALG